MHIYFYTHILIGLVSHWVALLHHQWDALCSPLTRHLPVDPVEPVEPVVDGVMVAIRGGAVEVTTKWIETMGMLTPKAWKYQPPAL